MLERYGRRYNSTMSGIADYVEQNPLEKKVISMFSILLLMWHPMMNLIIELLKGRNKSKNAIVQFTNGKFAKEALHNRKKTKIVLRTK